MTVIASRSWIDDLERRLTGTIVPAPQDPDEPPDHRWDTPGTLAKALNPKTVQTPALDLIDEALQKLVETPDGRLIITLAPQEGKSTRVAKDFVVWVLKHRPWTRVVTASHTQRLANRNGRAIRNTITEHPELRMRIAADNGSASEWQLAGDEGGVYSVGVGGGLVGRPADLIVIDDPIKDRKEADSEVYRQNVWDWWTDVASTRLAPGAPVVLILTRWHDDDLAGRLTKAEDGHLWKVLRIPAEADHDLEKGETDPLGRKPGEFLESARGRTTAQWQAIRTRVGSRTWQAQYQGRPSSATGTILKRGWWKFYDQAPWVVRSDGSRVVVGFDEVIQSWDMTFKDTKGTDFVVGQVWGRRGIDTYLLDQVRARMDFPATCQALRLLSAKWPQAVLKLVEDKANGPAVIAALQHTVMGIVAEEPQGSKVARASAASPLVEAGNVHLPAPELEADDDGQPFAWVGDFIEECAAFPTGTHDDQVDGFSQAQNRLILQPLLHDEEQFDEEDLDEELAGFSIAPY